jgi:DNA-binding MarR family transcriptional regulator
MGVTKASLALAYKNARDYPGLPAWSVLKDLLLQSLSPQEMYVYDLIKKNPGTFTTAICSVTGMEPNHVGNLVSNLERYGLIEREAATDRNGLYYKLKSVR